MPIRRLLPPRLRRFYVGHRSAIGFMVLFLSVLVSIAVAKNDSNQRAAEIRANGRTAFRQIERSRVEATRKSCHQRQVERRILRANFRSQREQTRQVPAGAFAQFNVTKRDAIDRLNKAIRSFHRLDCVAAVRDVRRSSPNFSP